MLQALSLRSRARKKSDDLTTAIVLAGTSFSRLCGNRVFLFVYAATSLFDQVNSVLSIHMRCRMTASLRATATLALRSQFRLASLMPKPLALTISGLGSATRRPLQIDSFAAWRLHTLRFDPTNRSLRTHGAVSSTQCKRRHFSTV